MTDLIGRHHPLGDGRTFCAPVPLPPRDARPDPRAFQTVADLSRGLWTARRGGGHAMTVLMNDASHHCGEWWPNFYRIYNATDGPLHDATDSPVHPLSPDRVGLLAAWLSDPNRMGERMPADWKPDWPDWIAGCALDLVLFAAVGAGLYAPEPKPLPPLPPKPPAFGFLFGLTEQGWAEFDVKGIDKVLAFLSAFDDLVLALHEHFDLPFGHEALRRARFKIAQEHGMRQSAVDLIPLDRVVPYLGQPQLTKPDEWIKGSWREVLDAFGLGRRSRKHLEGLRDDGKILLNVLPKRGRDAQVEVYVLDDSERALRLAKHRAKK